MLFPKISKALRTKPNNPSEKKNVHFTEFTSMSTVHVFLPKYYAFISFV